MTSLARPLRSRFAGIAICTAVACALLLIISLYSRERTSIPWPTHWGTTTTTHHGGGGASKINRPGPASSKGNNIGGNGGGGGGNAPLDDAPMLSDEQLLEIDNEVQSFVDDVVSAPYKDRFGEVGRRAARLAEWMTLSDASQDPAESERLALAVERAAGAVFPFLKTTTVGRPTQRPLADLRGTFAGGSRGVVIPTGSKTLRFAAHLVASLTEGRGLYGRTDGDNDDGEQKEEEPLPIEIVYAGDEDLHPTDRQLLQKRFPHVRFVDVSAAFGGDDLILGLKDGSWASKPFAALVSSFEEVILVDADSVFLQPPSVLLDRQPAYVETGAYFFHDRLLWQHAFQDRHAWWREQVASAGRPPSAALNGSLVWTEDYAEEADSGVVVLDKSRPGVVAALLHVCWQNTREVRDEVTYRITYGDKESWWFGFELAGAPYAFEPHYGSMVGWRRDETDPAQLEGDATSAEDGGGGEAEICSFVIAHVDDNDGLLWYNGGLLTNKKKDPTLFGLPTHYMVDGTWKKPGDRAKMSCMVGKEAIKLTGNETQILEETIRLAKSVDAEFNLPM